jgi:hypothetical protein
MSAGLSSGFRIPFAASTHANAQSSSNCGSQFITPPRYAARCIDKRAGAVTPRVRTNADDCAPSAHALRHQAVYARLQITTQFAKEIGNENNAEGCFERGIGSCGGAVSAWTRNSHIGASHEEYIASIRDGREVHLYGDRIKDVTTHPAFRNSVRMTARLYDAPHDPKTRDVLTCPTDLTTVYCGDWNVRKLTEGGSSIVFNATGSDNVPLRESRCSCALSCRRVSIPSLRPLAAWMKALSESSGSGPAASLPARRPDLAKAGRLPACRGIDRAEPDRVSIRDDLAGGHANRTTEPVTPYAERPPSMFNTAPVT